MKLEIFRYVYIPFGDYFPPLCFGMLLLLFSTRSCLGSLRPCCVWLGEMVIGAKLVWDFTLHCAASCVTVRFSRCVRLGGHPALRPWLRGKEKLFEIFRWSRIDYQLQQVRDFLFCFVLFHKRDESKQDGTFALGLFLFRVLVVSSSTHWGSNSRIPAANRWDSGIKVSSRSQDDRYVFPLEETASEWQICSFWSHSPGRSVGRLQWNSCCW